MKELFCTLLCLACHVGSLYAQSTTCLQKLTAVRWECGLPEYGDYRQQVYTDSTMYIKYYGGNDVLIRDPDKRYYLTSSVEYAFDESKVGKVANGTYMMTKNQWGSIACYKICELTPVKLTLHIVHGDGLRYPFSRPWEYTPMK